MTIVSYYPNASTLNGTEYAAPFERFLQWGRSGTVEDYRAAWHDHVNAMPLWPFYRKWIHQIITDLDVAISELAWLPLVKLPRPPDDPPTDEMVTMDRDILRRQLSLIEPSVLWIQSKEVYENAGGLLDRIQPRRVVQKLYKTKDSSRSEETPGILKALRRYLNS